MRDPSPSPILPRSRPNALVGRFDLTVLAPVAAGLLFLGVLAWRLKWLVWALNWNSDAAFFKVLAEDLATGPAGGIINVGNTPHYTTLWFLQLTRELPFYRQIWAVAPYLTSLAALVLIGWAAWKVGGRWVAAVTVSLALAASQPVLITQLMVAFRSHTWFADAAMMAFLVFLARKERLWTGPILVLGLAVALLAGLSLASDPLFSLSGLLPFLGAPLVLLLLQRHRRNIAKLFALTSAVSAAAIPIAVGVSSWMKSKGFAATFPSIRPRVVTFEELRTNLSTFAKAVFAMGNAPFVDDLTGLDLAAAALGAALTLSALGIFAALLWRTLVSTRAPNHGFGESDNALAIYVTFWVLSAMAVTLGFWITNIPVNGGPGTSRYLVPIFYAVVATVPMWARLSDRRRFAVSVGATAFCLLSLVFYSDKGRELSSTTLAKQAPRISHYLQGAGLTRGYSGYWEGHALTWQADMKVRAYPLWDCPPPAQPSLCAFPLAVRSAWYRPVPGSRSFLLMNPDSLVPLRSPSADSLGPPVEIRRFGAISIRVYDYDIASKFGPRA